MGRMKWTWGYFFDGELHGLQSFDFLNRGPQLHVPIAWLLLMFFARILLAKECQAKQLETVSFAFLSTRDCGLCMSNSLLPSLATDIYLAGLCCRLYRRAWPEGPDAQSAFDVNERPDFPWFVVRGIPRKIEKSVSIIYQCLSRNLLILRDR